MRRLGIAIAAFVAFAGTSALAQSVTGVTGFGTSTFNGGKPVAGAGSDASPDGQTSFNAYAITDQPVITFESSNQVGGTSALTTSISSINIGLSGNQNGFQFQSTITAAGMGMYLADTSGECVQSGSCSQASSDFAFLHLVPGTAVAAPIGDDPNIIGYAYFDFKVQGFDGDNLSTLYSLAGLMELQQLIDGSLDAQILPLVGVAGPNQTLNSLDDLKNFRVVDDTVNSYGVAWDATAFSFNVPGGIQNLIYTSTVETYSGGVCDEALKCLVAYSAFGDPIGRGGVSLESAAFSLFSFSAFSAESESTDGITSITGTPASFNRPAFVNGALVFQAVPEPATWMSLIMGFGLLGAAMRRRRVLAPA